MLVSESDPGHHRPLHLIQQQHHIMKVLATLALVIGLTSCGTCPLSPKKDCCKSGTSCDSKKTTDCKTCKH